MIRRAAVSSTTAMRSLTPRRVGWLLTAIVVALWAIALDHAPGDDHPTAEILAPVLDTAIALYGIAVVLIGVAVYSRSRGSARWRAAKTGVTVSLLSGVAAVLGVLVLLAPFMLLALAILNIRWHFKDKRRGNIAAA